MTARALLLSALLFLGLFSGASAAVLQVSGGLLVGAQQVIVGGTPYDVAFRDGTCAVIFSGCDHPSDFTFSLDSINASLAAQALLDQVFLDGPMGNFDSQPAATIGCGNPSFCEALIPFVPGAFFAALNFSVGGDFATVISTSPQEHFEFHDHVVFAVFTPSTAMPVPATVSLLGAALLGLGWARRRSISEQWSNRANKSAAGHMFVRRGLAKGAVTLGFAVTAAIAVSSPVFAQEKGVTYVGSLGGGKKGCPLNATDIQVEIKGTKVNGFWVETSDVKPKFKGDMAGSSFKIVRESKAGNQSSIAGELIDGKLEVRFVAPKCNYRAVLKPQA